ncbi:MAG TPA: zinc-dependent alcohol dehydrogenase family protein [Gemmatimonadaceae bacterium]
MTVEATAMLLDAPRTPLRAGSVRVPDPGPNEVLVRVGACAVCRTDLHIVDGELIAPRLPVVPGHEIVGTIEAVGPNVPPERRGQRVGIPWLGWTCGECEWCTSGRENLCPRARFTGLHINGGYATYTVADARYALPLPAGTTDVAAAPLLCAGLIGHRAYRMAGDAPVLGLYGFGAAAHIIAQVAIAEGRRVLAFTRPGDGAGQDFARSLGAAWAGGSDQSPPEPLDAAIIFAPVGALVPAALRAVKPGGVVVCAGIHMSDIPSFPYSLLWQERVLRSVANLTRADGAEFMALVTRVPIHTETRTYPLGAANDALNDLRAGRINGAAVLVP